eukprot:158306-Rhodomonas_salina.2
MYQDGVRFKSCGTDFKSNSRIEMFSSRTRQIVTAPANKCTKTQGTFEPSNQIGVLRSKLEDGSPCCRGDGRGPDGRSSCAGGMHSNGAFDQTTGAGTATRQPLHLLLFCCTFLF